ncbi:hypothetical protein HELRODRAFT_173164 [Helobdella robusta]|uniref:Uncharacterized protein n=1 Tax=Helobdella robusta TaxID=6412 RepID=T1F6H5_HELRO|nr:hypothetical protein HELRODRAFT_173164 [Helobdella robusta]ESO04087.1 hypothetical protein HELRODRAFT_173164 [Helobdella robusta]
MAYVVLGFGRFGQSMLKTISDPSVLQLVQYCSYLYVLQKRGFDGFQALPYSVYIDPANHSSQDVLSIISSGVIECDIAPPVSQLLISIEAQVTIRKESLFIQLYILTIASSLHRSMPLDPT